MASAHDYLPIPDRATGVDHEPYEGMELDADTRALLDIEERFVPGPAGAPDVRVLTYRAKAATGTLPVLINIHGGAFCFMSPDSFPLMDAGFALMHSCQVVSIDYRLAPEHPYPAAPEDCYAVLEWVATTDELDIDTDRLVVTGGSAGGALAAALCQMTRDRGGPAISYQALLIPVTDDRMTTSSMRDYHSVEGFTSTASIGMWLHYLGEDADRDNTPAYAAPMRAESLADLPPACVIVNGLDPLRDEGILYAMALMDAGVQVELHCNPNAYHGAVSLDEQASARGQRVYMEAIGQALQG